MNVEKRTNKPAVASPTPEALRFAMLKEMQGLYQTDEEVGAACS